MIVLNLCCQREHLFEGWFASTSTYEEQRARDLIACPVCGSTIIDRRPTAPYVQTRAPLAPPARPAPAPAAQAAPEEAAAALISALRRAARQAEDVGERFPEEARRIHYGDAEKRSIRGQASPDALGDLADEGIMVLPVPPDADDLH